MNENMEVLSDKMIQFFRITQKAGRIYAEYPARGYYENAVNRAVNFAINKANKLDDLNARGHALDILKETFPDIFKELQKKLK